MGLRTLIAAFLAAVSICAAVAETKDADPVVLKVRILYRDPEARQLKDECPAEAICLRHPVSFTVNVQEVLLGTNMPRRLHVILWIHTSPPGVDLSIVGTRTPSGDVEASEWNIFEYGGCSDSEAAQSLHIEEQVQELQRTGRLPCVQNDGPVDRAMKAPRP